MLLQHTPLLLAGWALMFLHNLPPRPGARGSVTFSHHQRLKSPFPSARWVQERVWDQSWQTKLEGNSADRVSGESSHAQGDLTRDFGLWTSFRVDVMTEAAAAWAQGRQPEVAEQGERKTPGLRGQRGARFAQCGARALASRGLRLYLLRFFPTSTQRHP